MPTKAAVIWILASLLFLGIGGFCLLILAVDWREYRRTANWIPVDATIDSVQLDRTGTGRHRTSQLHCQYTYSVDGQTYHGTRVGIINGGISGADINAPPHFEVLDKYRKSRASFPALVNPANGAESLLFRDFGGVRFYGLLLGGLAFVLFPTICWWSYFRIRAARRAA